MPCTFFTRVWRKKMAPDFWKYFCDHILIHVSIEEVWRSSRHLWRHHPFHSVTKKTFFFLHFSFCLFLSFFCKSLFALLSKKWTEQVPLLLRSKDLAGVKKNFDRPIFAQTVFEERPHHFTSLQFASQSLLLNKKVDRRVSLSVSSFTWNIICFDGNDDDANDGDDVDDDDDANDGDVDRFFSPQPPLICIRKKEAIFTKIVSLII